MSNKAKAAYVIQQVEAKQQEQSILPASGVFAFENDGFYFRFKEGVEFIKWTDIVRIDAYKADLITIDEIRLDIVSKNFQFTITEETPGWDGFVEKSKEVFNTIPKEWNSVITRPAFKTNLTIIYERDS